MKTQLGPGVWEDDNGDVHVSIPDLLKHFHFADTPENRTVLDKVCKDVIAENWPNSKIIDTE